MFSARVGLKPTTVLFELTTTMRDFPKQHYSTGLCNGDEVCFRKGRAKCLNVMSRNTMLPFVK